MVCQKQKEEKAKKEMTRLICRICQEPFEIDQTNNLTKKESFQHVIKHWSQNHISYLLYYSIVFQLNRPDNLQNTLMEIMLK